MYTVPGNCKFRCSQSNIAEYSVWKHISPCGGLQDLGRDDRYWFIYFLSSFSSIIIGWMAEWLRRCVQVAYASCIAVGNRVGSNPTPFNNLFDLFLLGHLPHLKGGGDLSLSDNNPNIYKYVSIFPHCKNKNNDIEYL